MALAYERLYQSENLARVEMAPYINSLVDHVASSVASEGHFISLHKNIQKVSFGIDTAIPLGFIITELVTNALKHAFTSIGQGSVHVELSRVNSKTFRLLIRDNGVGLPGDIDFDDPDSFGIKLVSIFVRQLGGTIRIIRKAGTELHLNFYVDSYLEGDTDTTEAKYSNCRR
jgi:two-component system, sensor histidine kinase PdtaS